MNIILKSIAEIDSGESAIIFGTRDEIENVCKDLHSEYEVEQVYMDACKVTKLKRVVVSAKKQIENALDDYTHGTVEIDQDPIYVRAIVSSYNKDNKTSFKVTAKKGGKPEIFLDIMDRVAIKQSEYNKHLAETEIRLQALRGRIKPDEFFEKPHTFRSPQIGEWENEALEHRAAAAHIAYTNAPPLNTVIINKPAANLTGQSVGRLQRNNEVLGAVALNPDIDVIASTAIFPCKVEDGVGPEGYAKAINIFTMIAKHKAAVQNDESEENDRLINLRIDAELADSDLEIDPTMQRSPLKQGLDKILDVIPTDQEAKHLDENGEPFL